MSAGRCGCTYGQTLKHFSVLFRRTSQIFRLTTHTSARHILQRDFITYTQITSTVWSKFSLALELMADPSDRPVLGEGLRLISCSDCGFKFRRERESLSFVSVMCCEVKGLCEGPISRPEKSYGLRYV